jgi:NAD(P)-dependent dehydrogenase (short-subunit alcohol dehydrogenase family)
MSTAEDIIRTQKRNLPILATRETCEGRTYIVTGANCGLGYEAAKHLAALGAAKVIITARNAEAGAKAKAAIEATTGTTTGSGGIVECWPLDLSSYESVKAFARRAAEELDRIDGVIENAAVASPDRTFHEGHLTTLTVNVLGTFLLAVLLLPTLAKHAARLGTTPRLCFVSTRTGFTHEDDWNRLRDDPLAGLDDDSLEPLTTSV